MITAFAGMLLSFGTARAQNDRTFVATTGADSITCGTHDAPCRSFNVALPKTNGGGEVIALDSGTYDSFNVGVSISVTLAAAPGVHAELPGVTINTPASDTVILRNLYVSKQASGGAGDGIKVTGVGTLHIENCVVHGFTTGINFDLNHSAQVFIQDTVVRRSIADGVTFFTSSGLIKASIDKSHFDDNGTSGVYNGVNVLGRSRVTARDSTASGNGGAGFTVSGGDLNLENCEASNNKDGVVTLEPGNAIVSNSVVTNNSRYGFWQNGGTFYSRGDNTVRRNGNNTSGIITAISGT